MTDHDHRFHCMGTDCRVLVGQGAGGDAEARTLALQVERLLHRIDARLSRFRPDSELCALNADRRDAVPASGLMRAAVAAGVWAAERTDGLVDPTLVAPLEAAGYSRSRDGAPPAPLALALAVAPRRVPARPHPTASWRKVLVDDGAEVVRRPPGLRLDTGGTGKGLAADLAARVLGGAPRFAVDCGGDVRFGGDELPARPYEVEVEHPLTGEVVHVIRMAGGAIATSGINVRLWETAGGRYAHHLLDPSTGRPAWTGLVGVTALGTTALEAETLAKAALLSGPVGARRFLAEHGGVLVRDDGAADLVGPLAPRYVVRVRRPERAA